MEYSRKVAEMGNWNYTGFVRTYNKIDPSVADNWSKKLASRKCIDKVFCSLETDKYSDSDHLHFALEGRNLNEKKIMYALNIPQKNP